MEQTPIRADTLLDVAPDDRSAGSGGGTRRPGNLWTAQAREDMFRRREAGETWETICLVRPMAPTMQYRVRRLLIMFATWARAGPLLTSLAGVVAWGSSRSLTST